VSLAALFARWGLIAVGAGAGLEGETAAVLGGIFADQGYWPVWAAAVAAAAGSFAVDQACFYLGRHAREHRWVVRLRRTKGYAKALKAFERHPIGFIFAFRFLYGLRTVSPLAIGTSKIRTRTFLPANLAAACLWSAIFTGIGYAFGRAFERWVGELTPYLPWVIAAAAATVVLGFAVHRLRGHHHPHEERA
jgi:membrane protein DedA with SNARE-associated domain